MYSQSIRIRPFNVGGAFELILPSGKVVLIDPFFSNEFDKIHTREDVTGADYIIVTHSHLDHEMDLGYFVKKYNSMVFCGALSAEALIKYHQLPYDNVVPVFPGQSYTMDDFSIEFWSAKHNPNGGRSFEEIPPITKDFNVPNHARCDQLGSLESLDFMLTTPNHFSILMASGRILWQELFDVCRQKHPNMLLRQAGIRNAGGDIFSAQQVSAKELAAILVRYQAQLIMPFHHDVFLRRWGQEKTDAYFAEVAEEVQKLSPGAMFVNPKTWKWYDIGMRVTVDA